jgi:hypothetical protein
VELGRRLAIAAAELHVVVSMTNHVDSLGHDQGQMKFHFASAMCFSGIFTNRLLQHSLGIPISAFLALGYVIYRGHAIGTERRYENVANLLPNPPHSANAYSGTPLNALYLLSHRLRANVSSIAIQD